MTSPGRCWSAPEATIVHHGRLSTLYRYLAVDPCHQIQSIAAAWALTYAAQRYGQRAESRHRSVLLAVMGRVR